MLDFKMEKARNERLECIKIVLKEFDEQNINYCILRNYEFLLGDPMPIESLDAVVSERDLSKIDEILLKAKSIAFFIFGLSDLILFAIFFLLEIISVFLLSLFSYLIKALSPFCLTSLIIFLTMFVFFFTPLCLLESNVLSLD